MVGGLLGYETKFWLLAIVCTLICAKWLEALLALSRLSLKPLCLKTSALLLEAIRLLWLECVGLLRLLKSESLWLKTIRLLRGESKIGRRLVKSVAHTVLIQ